MTVGLQSSLASELGTPPTENGSCERTPIWLRALLGTIIAAGLAMRLAFPGTTCFCNDQACACALAEDVAAGRWESAGLVNSGGFRNPPGFVYLLAGVWRVWPDPAALLHFISIANIAAVLLSAWLTRRWVGQAAAWWSTAMLSSAPWPIQYSRWIWAQDLLFPSAVVVYLFLWLWIARGRPWAVLGVILSLAAVVQIHLVGVVLALACVILVVWCRPKLSIAPLAIGAAMAASAFLPYLLSSQLTSPGGQRIGYQHFWRVIPAAAMSVSGLGWQLEFKDGYTQFARDLGWRRYAYDAAGAVSVLLLAGAAVAAIVILWRGRNGLASRRSAMGIATMLTVLIPVSFILLAIRTSPTYMPVWYPLPFVLMGWATTRLLQRSRRLKVWVFLLLLGTLGMHLAFFAEQTLYINRHEGVPGSILGPSYAGLKKRLPAMTGIAANAVVDGAEIKVSFIQSAALPYLLRHEVWSPGADNRWVIRYEDAATGRTWAVQADNHAFAGDEQLLARQARCANSELPLKDAFQLHPWSGPQQEGGVILQFPKSP